MVTPSNHVTVFIEGGAKGALAEECRIAFGKLFAKLQLRFQPKFIACGGRRQAYDRWCSARNESSDTIPILLVDSEGPVMESKKWDHVLKRPGDQWNRPDGATESHLYFMVQSMESWFLRDPEGLAAYYGQGFAKRRLGSLQAIETLSTDEVNKRLKSALKDTTKRCYKKGRDSFKILERIQPDKLSGCKHAQEVFDFLRQYCGR